MATKEINLPDIGEGVTEGELVKWLVAKGDAVEEDQPLAEVMTDKASVEVPSPVSGVVGELKATEGDMLPIGAPMLVLEVGAGGAKAAPAVKVETEKKEASVSSASTSSTSQTTSAQGNSEDVHPPVSNVLATPATRRLAREMNVDINQITGTGNAGRVTREDLLAGGSAAASNTSTSNAAAVTSSTKTSENKPTPVFHNLLDGAAKNIEERVPLRGVRKKIAENMQLYKQIIPHFTLMDDANVSELVKLRTGLKPKAEKLGVKVTYLSFVMKALIATLREFPMVNASIDDAAGEIVYKKYYNIGFAADTPNGLLVPVIKNADRKSILQISQEIVELSTKARNGKLSLDEMRGATVTVTNIGSIGGNYATPIINHPEVMILGMYKISDKPVVVNGALDVEKTMNFTATADHRLIDGAVAARFLSSFIERIENPGVLMLDLI